METDNSQQHNELYFVGTVRSVRGQIVEIEREGSYIPALKEVLLLPDAPGVRLETYAHRTHRRVVCLSLARSSLVPRNAKVIGTGEELSIPVGRGVLGRVINLFGEPQDGRGDISREVVRNIHLSARVALADQPVYGRDDVTETGIKAIDFFTPFIRGGRIGIIGGAGVGKTILMTELLRGVIRRHSGVALFAGIGERIREGHELWRSLEVTKVLDKTLMILGQMNEHAATRFRIAAAAATAAEYFRDIEHRDVLLVVDNIFRFVQAGSELSALLEEIPSEFGYQATLESELADFEGRLVSTTDAAITSIQTVYVPSDEFIDPAVTAVLPHLDSVVILSRNIAQRGLYPPIDLSHSFSTIMSPDILGAEHHRSATEALGMLAQYERLSRVVAIIGETELSPEDRTIYQRAEKIKAYMTQSLFTTEAHTSRLGVFVARDQTIRDVRSILDGKYDSIPAGKFRFIGDIPGAKLT